MKQNFEEVITLIWGVQTNTISREVQKKFYWKSGMYLKSKIHVFWGWKTIGECNWKPYPNVQ